VVDFLTLSINSCKRKDQVVEQVCKQYYLMSVILKKNSLIIFSFLLFPNPLMRSTNQKNTHFFSVLEKFCTNCKVFILQVKFEAIELKWVSFAYALKFCNTGTDSCIAILNKS